MLLGFYTSSVTGNNGFGHGNMFIGLHHQYSLLLRLL
jgi:hypothetical protein